MLDEGHLRALGERNPAAPDENSEDAAGRREGYPELYAAIDRLFEQERQAVLLRLSGNLPVGAIAEFLGLKEREFRRLYADAMRNLRRLLDPEGAEQGRSIPE